MAIRQLRYEGDEILKKKSRDVEKIDEKILTLIDDMIETMHKYNGVGLAAVQVGILKKVIVIDIYDDNGPVAMINPVILKTKGA
ncbi:MAG: peptide deformylase, partial [Clostridia bacterium]|nr:peptide deformylase [Clostridia bacterium]